MKEYAPGMKKSNTTSSGTRKFSHDRASTKSMDSSAYYNQHYYRKVQQKRIHRTPEEEREEEVMRKKRTAERMRERYGLVFENGEFRKISSPHSDSTRIQTKGSLTVSSPGDENEHKADSIADQVMRESNPEKEEERIQSQIKPEKEMLHRQSGDEEKREEDTMLLKSEDSNRLMRKGGSGATLDRETEDRVNSLRGRGAPLPDQTREFMENRLGADFSEVRVHTGNEAVELSNRLNAKAFTYGKDIAFNKGEFSPESQQGKRLLAHELAHTVQQGAVGNNVQKFKIQRWAFPTDWLDYLGLGIDVVERIYIELAYEEGDEKEYQRALNTFFMVLDLIFAALPVAGGGGLAARGSREGLAFAWAGVPASVKLEATELMAREMGWSVAKAGQFINAMMRGGEERSAKGGGSEHKYSGKKVEEILKQKKGSIREAPLEPGSPSWDQILNMTWEEIDAAAKSNTPGYKTIRKLLSDTRFDK